MASITPRASGFWADESRMSSYFPGEDDLEQQQHLISEEDQIVNDGRTPLDKTIDRIGMGSYQWTLLSLCGFGWLADNMWIQAVAIILPRLQQHYSVPDSYIGTVSSSMFAGMMFGAVGWGTCSDLMGRSTAFNATLFFTAVFGLLASFTNSFPSLCVVLFFLGSSVGGSMPTDGTLLLEHMPQGKQYLVTALSVFFSFGAVLAAIVALLVLPQHSCSASLPTCNIETENQGWKYLLIGLGLITLSMFLARILFFRLHESPRYLVHAGRPQEALKSLQMISQFNGSDLSIELEDVQDHRSPIESPIDERIKDSPNVDDRQLLTSGGSTDSPTEAAPQSGADSVQTVRPTLVTHYDATGESPKPLDAHSASKTAEEHMPPTPFTENGRNGSPYSPNTPRLSSFTPSHIRPTRSDSQASRSSRYSASRTSIYGKKASRILPWWIRKPMRAWWVRVCMVLEPEWLRTSILVWATWWTMSLAYTMFNVFLPKLLETGAGSPGIVDLPKSLEETLWDVVIFTIGGCPGAILGAYMIETPLGRRWSLAGSTFVTAFFCVVFVMVESSLAVRASTVGISLSATAMWAVLYGWTPEIFGTKVRGTACGIASALSRIGGMIAPMLGGTLLMIDRSFPVYASIVIFVIAGICVLMLKEEEGDSSRTKGDRAMIH